MALCVLAALAGLDEAARPSRLFVDIGSGIGLSTLLARDVLKAQVVTVEPSASGDFAQELLGVETQRAYIESLPPEILARLAATPTRLHLNSVIEHLEQPLAVLADLAARTQIEAVAAIVPDADGIDFAGPIANAIPFLAPSDHLHLPTREGMQRLFARAGFAHTVTTAASGLMLALGSHAPLSLPTPDEITAARDALLDHLLHHPNPRVAGGAAVRLLPAAIQAGDADRIAVLSERLADLDPEVLATDFARRRRMYPDLPFYLPVLAYWRGFEATGRGAPDEALPWLRLVEPAAKALLAYQTTYASQALDYLRSAQLAMAYALRVAGDLDGAEAVLMKILGPDDSATAPRALFKAHAQEALQELHAKRRFDVQVAEMTAAIEAAAAASAEAAAAAEAVVAVEPAAVEATAPPAPNYTSPAYLWLRLRLGVMRRIYRLQGKPWPPA